MISLSVGIKYTCRRPRAREFERKKFYFQHLPHTKLFAKKISLILPFSEHLGPLIFASHLFDFIPSSQVKRSVKAAGPLVYILGENQPQRTRDRGLRTNAVGILWNAQRRKYRKGSGESLSGNKRLVDITVVQDIEGWDNVCL